MTATTTTTAGLGWQLHNDHDNHDKYYRVLIARTPQGRALYVIGYGRRGSSPNLTFSRQFTTVQAATDFATEKASDKLASGYQITVDPTEFTIPEDLLSRADETFDAGQRVEPHLCNRIYDAFSQAVGHNSADL